MPFALISASTNAAERGRTGLRHTFFCVDGHTCGNPVRLVAGGAPLLPASTMSEKRQDFLARFDWIRTALMFEPRGHDVMSGSILYPPTRRTATSRVLFIEVSGCLPMCGHGTIGTVTMALEHGLVTPREPGRLLLDTPAGRVVAEYDGAGRFVEKVRLTNVASYLAADRGRVDCPVSASWSSTSPMAATSTPSSSRSPTIRASRNVGRPSSCACRPSCAGA